MKVHPIRLGKVVANCYLIQEEGKFMLVDTGRVSKKKKLLSAMREQGCHPEDLELIVMTHGHFDHTGLGAHFQRNHGIRIVMHSAAAKKVVSGDMFHGNKAVPVIQKKIVNTLFKIQKYSPNIQMKESFDLSSYGFNAKVISTPGHSEGSVSVLLRDGQLICGDLFENDKKPQLNSIMEDVEIAKDSVEKLKNYEITKVYPGHGEAFEFVDLVE